MKPSNVLIAEDGGRVVLTDFGIAQVEATRPSPSTGMLSAPPPTYSVRARGHKPGPADPDLWSLGGCCTRREGAHRVRQGVRDRDAHGVMTEPLEEPKNADPLRRHLRAALTQGPRPAARRQRRRHC
ncbi:hypothetical protein GCM10023238_18680 [Streptomyces heliomycini]